MSTEVEQTIAAVANKAMYGGAGTGITGWIMSNNFIGLMGVLIAIVGLGVNWYYRHKQDKRENVEHLERMRAIGK